MRIGIRLKSQGGGTPLKAAWQSWPNNLRVRYLLAAVVTVIVVATTSVVLWVTHSKPTLVMVNGIGGKVTFWSKDKTVGDALSHHDITLGPKDQVTPALTTKLKAGGEIEVAVVKAVSVTVVADGRTTTTDTLAHNVGELLKELNITVGEKDVVSADPNAPLTVGMKLQVTRRSEEVQVAQLEIPFDTEKQEDRNMNAGTTREVQAGSPGIKEVKTKVVMEDGKEVSREVVEEKVVQEPQNRVVAYGTAGVVSRGGQTFRYTKELTLTATGYTAGKESNPNGNGYTYTGMRATFGVVAVDPRVIPLYTRLYIEGYGPAVAGDIGGAIHGNRIDLCFDSLSEALNWGVRTVKVYILSD